MFCFGVSCREQCCVANKRYTSFVFSATYRCFMTSFSELVRYERANSSRLCHVISRTPFLLYGTAGYSITRDRLSRLEIRFVVGVSVISIYLGGFEIIIGGFQVRTIAYTS